MNITHPKPYKYFPYFLAIFITLYLTQEVLLNRLILIGPGYVTGGTFIYFATPLLTDVVAEVYGYRVARQMLWCGIFAMLFLAITLAIVLRLPYPPFWQNTAESYTIALKSTARAVIVGDIAILVGQFLNAYLITKWKILVRGRYFWLRSVGSSIVGDTITVSLAILGIFGGRMSTDALLTTLIPELVIMVFFTALGAFPASIIAKILAKAENLNNFDIGVNFNPFKLDASN